MRFPVLFAVIAAFLVPNIFAQNVRVITRDIQPFAFQKNGQWTGFAMELWEDVAREMKMPYEVTAADSAQQMVDAVRNKTADVGVGALSITAEREKVIDFSQPFYESGLQIVVSKRPPSALDTVTATLGSVLNWKSVGSFALLIFVMLVISHLVWMYEHKINEEMWPKSYGAGMWESFWWSISTLLVGGADNKGPIGVGGRIVAIVWMLLSIVLIALLTGSFAANLTIDKLQGDISGPLDLPGKKVATVGGSAPEAWLKKHDVKDVTPFKTVEECVAALKAGQVKAVVYDAPLLKYALTNANDDSLGLVPGVFDPSNYGFALQQDSPIRERINQALLTLAENGTTQLLRERYFGKEE